MCITKIVNKTYLTIFNRRYVWEDSKYVGWYYHK